MRVITKIYIPILLTLIFQTQISAQDLSGNWQGRFSLQGSTRQWSFELDLQQDNSSIQGIGKQIELSKNNQANVVNATFTIGGNFNGQQLTYDMQEVMFLKSPNGQCLSHCEYRFHETISKYQFIGECNRNGVFYKNGDYIPMHSSCQFPATTQVIFEKAKDINGRKTEIVAAVPVEASSVMLHIWDNDKVDGDIISLQLNGYWILKNHRLTKQVKRIKVNLPEAANELVLYAENLGSLPPNTAAISIWDGKEKIQERTLNSDEGRSEAIQFIKQ